MALKVVSKEVSKEATVDTKREENVRRGKRAKRKGGQYERVIAGKFKKAYKVDLKRTPQSGGFAKKSDKADDYRGDITIVDTKQMLKVHIECKNCKSWSLPSWIKQAESDCPDNRTPIVVFHQHNTSKDYVCLSLEDFFSLVERDKIVGKRVFK